MNRAAGQGGVKIDTTVLEQLYNKNKSKIVH